MFRDAGLEDSRSDGDDAEYENSDAAPGRRKDSCLCAPGLGSGHHRSDTGRGAGSETVEDLAD
eukprot:11111462-Lingulodinium_polyedra.AAC.1